MIKKFNLIILLTIFILLLSCSNEIDPESLPSFDGINANENTIYFLTNRGMFDYMPGRSDTAKIYAIDTASSKKIYTYEFKRHFVEELVYDASFDINPYILIRQYADAFDNIAVKINVKSGGVERLDIDFNPAHLNIINGRLLLIQPTSSSGSSEKYFLYNRNMGAPSPITPPKGTYISDAITLDSNDYLYLYYNNAPKIYNFTTKKFLNDNLFTTNYGDCSFYSNKYLFAKGSTLDIDVYELTSLEPNLVYSSLFSYNSKHIYNIATYGDDNYLYIVTNEYDSDGYKNSAITKRDRQQSYNIIDQITFNNKYIWQSYYKNGSIWLLAGDNYNGTAEVYKINTNDLTYRIID